MQKEITHTQKPDIGYADIFQSIKDPLVNYVFKKAMAGLVTRFNWLGWLLPNWIASQVLYIVIKYGFVETKLIVIRIDKIEDRKEFDDKKDKYDQAKELADDPEKLKKREQELIDSFRNHIKFG